MLLLCSQDNFFICKFGWGVAPTHCVTQHAYSHIACICTRGIFFNIYQVKWLNAINYFILILVRTNKAQSNIENGYSRGNYIYWKFYALEIRYKEVNVDIKSKCNRMPQKAPGICSAHSRKNYFVHIETCRQIY